MTPDLLTVPEVADALHVHPITVRRWIADGTLPAIKLGATYRIDADDLRAHIDSARTTAPGQSDTDTPDPCPPAALDA